MQKFLALFLSLVLCLTTVACGDSSTSSQYPSQPTNNTRTVTNNISDGTYPVQQASYNDVDGEYTIMVLNTPPGSSPVYRTTNLQMARLTDEEIEKGEKTYLEIKDNQPVMHLSEDFKIEYVHNVTETQTNPQSGRTETVIVRQQSSFWAPFAGALAGQAVGSLLFTPQYYFPPVYQPGGVLTGYGSYGSTYDQAAANYQTRYQTPPPAVRNNQARSTGTLRQPSSTSTRRNTTTNRDRSTGGGYGGSTLTPSGQNGSRTNKPRGSFGSSTGSKTRSRSRRRR